MRKKKFFIFFIFCFFYFFFLIDKVFSSLKINEIYPAPPTGQYEWVEIYNESEEIIYLSNYSLFDLSGKKIIFSTQSALPKSFVLATSSGVLNNTGQETVFLKYIDNQIEEIIDIASYSGSFDSGKSYGRCSDKGGSWYVLTSLTQEQTNNSACLLLSPSPTPTMIFPSPTEVLILTPTSTVLPTPFPTPTPSPNLISYENIFLSEVMVNPSTGENEWIELYNNNDFSVDLIDWFIDDVENSGGSPKKFSLTIPAKSYQVFELSSAIFNNNGDSVRLLDFNKVEKDSFEYQGSEKGKSWGRITFDSDLFCLQEASKNQVNNLCLSSTPTIGSTKTLSSISSLPSILKPSLTVKKSTSGISGIERKANQKIYQSYSPKEKGDVLGAENLGNKMMQMNDFSLEKESANENQNPLLFLLLYYSALANFLFLRRILMAIEIKNQ